MPHIPARTQFFAVMCFAAAAVFVLGFVCGADTIPRPATPTHHSSTSVAAKSAVLDDAMPVVPAIDADAAVLGAAEAKASGESNRTGDVLDVESAAQQLQYDRDLFTNDLTRGGISAKNVDSLSQQVMSASDDVELLAFEKSLPDHQPTQLVAEQKQVQSELEDLSVTIYGITGRGVPQLLAP